MTILEVEAESLHAVAREVTESVHIAGNVRAHHDRMAAHAAHAGHPEVTDALGHFLSKWAYGCGCLVQDGEQVAEALEAAARIYRHVEARISRGMTPWPRRPL